MQCMVVCGYRCCLRVGLVVLKCELPTARYLHELPSKRDVTRILWFSCVRSLVASAVTSIWELQPGISLLRRVIYLSFWAYFINAPRFISTRRRFTFNTPSRRNCTENSASLNRGWPIKHAPYWQQAVQSWSSPTANRCLCHGSLKLLIHNNIINSLSLLSSSRTLVTNFDYSQVANWISKISSKMDGSSGKFRQKVITNSLAQVCLLDVQNCSPTSSSSSSESSTTKIPIHRRSFAIDPRKFYLFRLGVWEKGCCYLQKGKDSKLISAN